MGTVCETFNIPYLGTNTVTSKLKYGTNLTGLRNLKSPIYG